MSPAPKDQTEKPSIGGERLTSYEHDGLVFDVIDEGPVDGPVIVLLHGFPQRASSWSKVTPPLNEAGFRTLAPDQRGYSRGARPRGRSAYRMANLVGDVVALIELAGGPVHLVGHDWGAAVAWSTAASRPELVTTLTTVSVPHPAAMVRSMLVSTQALASWYMGAFQLPVLPERLLADPRRGVAALRRTGMPAEAIEAFRRGMVEDGALHGGLGWYRAMPFLGPSSLTEKVRVPTTHVWSDGDHALVRRGAELTSAYVVDAPFRLKVLEGVSHWVLDEAPDRLAELILEQIGGSTA